MHPAVKSERDAAASFTYWGKGTAAGDLEIHSCHWVYRMELWVPSLGCMNCNSERKRETQSVIRKRAVGGKLVVVLPCAELLEKILSSSKPKPITT